MGAPDAGFTEIADRVWVARSSCYDLNITAVVGELGIVVVDTHGSGAAARGVLRDLADAVASPVVAVVNAHEHFDHTFGNAVFLEAVGPVPIHAHEVAASRTRQAGERMKRVFEASEDDPRRDEVLATQILPATSTMRQRHTIDLGDRAVDLLHLGRGHTGGDLVVHVRDAGVVVAGDLVEESAPPVLGGDSYPLEWPDTLGRVLDLAEADDLVVPGHGAVVGHPFVREQQSALTQVAETILRLVAADVPLEDALESAEWPYQRDVLEAAVARGYRQA